MSQLRYRPDVDGLRAAAVAGVLFFHAGVPLISGGFAGVDIFFVISGYLITSLLFLELDRTGRIDFVNFWARRTRRILPSALLVVVATVAGAYVLTSSLAFYYTARDAIYAALYVINWQQLAASLDYFNEEGGGLFLHYWSLAVEEQFYLFLTLVFALALGSWRFISRKGPWTSGHVAVALLAVLGILSFIANIVLAPEAQPVAFFGTHARIWELCLGSGVALLERRGWRPRTELRSAMAWLGVAAIAFTFLAYDAEKIAYPGIYAVLPTLGAALLILAGVNASDMGLPIPLRLGAALIPVAIGKLSYALYLWHWPVFELYQTYFGSWTKLDRAIALGATLLLSIASHVLVENPIRFSKGLSARPLQGLGAALAVTLLIVVSAESLGREAGRRNIVLPNGVAFAPKQVKRDRASPYRDDCHVGLRATNYASCIYAKRNSPHRLFLIGDSHALQWFPAVEGFAEKYDLALYSRTKSDCMVAEVSVFSRRLGRIYHECDQWRARVLEEIERIRPEMVIIGLSSTRQAPVRPGTSDQWTGAERLAVFAEVERKMIKRIAATGAQLVMIADTPTLPADPLDCLVESGGSTWRCRWPEQETLPRNGFPWSFKPDKPPPGVTVIDFSDQLCWNGYCYAANETHVIMRDTHHVTAAFSATLSDVLEQRLAGVLRVPIAGRNIE